jgi:hypothetical protein
MAISQSKKKENYLTMWIIHFGIYVAQLVYSIYILLMPTSFELFATKFSTHFQFNLIWSVIFGFSLIILMFNIHTRIDKIILGIIYLLICITAICLMVSVIHYGDLIPFTTNSFMYGFLLVPLALPIFLGIMLIVTRSKTAKSK